MKTIVVTDGNERSALAVVRSLGRAGYRVVVAGGRERTLGGASRWAAQSVVTPEPLREPARFAEAVARIASEAGASLVVPVTDASVSALLAFPSQVPLPFSRDATATWPRISDKAEVARLAEQAGIRVPKHTLVAAPADVPATLAFPLVIKPSRSVAGEGDQRSKHGVTYAADADELRRRLAALPAAAFPVLLQERIVGPGVGVFLLRWKGELLAAMSHRRIREKPPSGGVSVLCESVALDPALRDRSNALMGALGWEGVAMVEYKLDAARGEPVLMEINGRFWGSLQLAIDAGVDFPLLLARAVLGASPAPVPVARSGVRSRWFWGDVDHVLTRLRRSARRLNLPPDAPGLLATIGGFVGTTLTPHHGQVWQSGDGGPARRELAERFFGA